MAAHLKAEGLAGYNVLREAFKPLQFGLQNLWRYGGANVVKHIIDEPASSAAHEDNRTGNTGFGCVCGGNRRAFAAAQGDNTGIRMLVLHPINNRFEILHPLRRAVVIEVVGRAVKPLRVVAVLEV